MGRLDGKVAIVTGAGKGIGAATAGLLASEGAKVLLTDIDQAAGEKAADEIQNRSDTASFIAHDVTDEAAWDKIVAHAVKVYGRLDILVNNAGIAPSGGPIEDLSLADWRHVTAIDLDSVFLGCKYAIRAMKVNANEKGGGSIINISSIMGLIGQPNAAAYNAAKGGVRLLTKVAALECAEAGYGIRVNSVHPGFVDTPLVRNAVNDGVIAGRMGSENEAFELLTLLHPIGRLGVPKDIANAILFLASDESSFMTGAELVVDGGYTAR
ncbi:MAG: glucose 1-dehydrogenase [Parvibaculum sp.]